MTTASSDPTTGFELGHLPLLPGDLLRVSGSEPLAALDRIVSQEVRTLRDGQGRLALLLAPKGQFRALMAVFRDGDDVLLLAPRGRGPELVAGLALYLKFNRVAAEPLGWDGGFQRLLGRGWSRVAAALGVSADAGACASAGAPGERILLLGETFTGAPGVTVAAESAAAGARLEHAMRAAGAAEVDERVVELARIRAGFPAWGRELTDAVLPPEVGLETVAISYTKGCYVGQETIARMKTYGRPNRRLAQVQQGDGPLDEPELPLDLLSGGEGRPKGTLTSWALDEAGAGIGLALVHRSVADGAVLSGSARSFRVAPPPVP